MNNVQHSSILVDLHEREKNDHIQFKATLKINIVMSAVFLNHINSMQSYFDHHFIDQSMAIFTFLRSIWIDIE